MLIDQDLIRLCEAILNDSISSEGFGNLLVQTGVKLEDNEWDIANKLLGKSEEMTHAIGGKDHKTVH